MSKELFKKKKKLADLLNERGMKNGNEIGKKKIVAGSKKTVITKQSFLLDEVSHTLST